MTLETYSYIKRQLDEVHDRIQNAPVSADPGAEAALIILEKLNMAVKDLLNAARGGD